jgi:YidC/Oxa1 family membrane protein insertase
MNADVMRIVLLGALGVVAYLLVLAWNEDYGGPPERTVDEAVRDPLVQSTPTVPMDVPSAGTLPEASNFTPGGDLPSVVALEEDVRRSPSSGELIRVSTDVLNVWVDTRGGDIVKVNLPAFPVSLDTPDIPMVLLDRSLSHVYIAQSGLVGPRGPDLPGDRPNYSVARSEYTLADSEDELVVPLTYRSADGIEVIKRFRFRRGDYLVDLDFDVRNASNEPWNGNLFAQIKRDDRDPPGEESITLGPRPYLGGAVTTQSSRYEKLDFEDLDEEPFREEVEGGWVALLQHYFLSAWIGSADETNTYYGRSHADGTYLVGFTSPGRTLTPGSTTTFTTAFYVGPKDQHRLEEIAPNLNLTVDYGFLWWLAVPLFDLMAFLQSYVVNWGVSIILLTLIVKLVLYPLSAASYRSMANMRRVAPQLKRVQERYSDDREKLMREMQALYKKEKINPLGGCLPIVLQMPVFISLYWVLYESVELRQAMFIPGWIDDLAVKDPVFVLPLLMGASMFGQQLLSPPVPDPMQQRMMRMMPIFFTALFLFFPAGLVLYWLTNNVLSIAQQWFITRRIERAGRPSRS